MKLHNVKYKDSKYTGIIVSYEPGGKVWPFKTVNKDIKVGQMVVIPTSTRYNMTVCKVMEVGTSIDNEEEIKEIISIV